MLIPELNLAYDYFNNNNLKFFNNIQKNNTDKDIIKYIKNMTWDLTHLNSISYNFCIKQNNKNQAILPVFISVDRGLLNIKKYFEIDMVVIDEKNFAIQRYYVNNKLIELKNGKVFFEKDFTLKRAECRLQYDSNYLSKLINEMESDLLKIFS